MAEAIQDCGMDGGETGKFTRLGAEGQDYILN